MIDNLELLNGFLVGRVEPHIYAFSTGALPHCLKVGDTYRPVSARLNEWKKHFPDLKEEYREKATVNDTIFFRDYSVHRYLEEAGRERLRPKDMEGLYYSNEFFRDTAIADLADAIKDIKDKYENGIQKYQYYDSKNRLPESYTYASTGEWKPRPNQQETIDNFVRAVDNGRTNLLMYAVMRFGKSFTSLCCAKAIKAKTVLVVSAKADVREEWKKTVQQADNFNKDYVFLTGRELADDENAVKNILHSGKGVVIFLTLQDLQGETIKDKHREIFENTIDLLIVDETHYGARAERYGQILRDPHYVQDIAEKYAEEDYVDYAAAEEELKVLDPKVKLHLSGTPYRILMGSEFAKEDIIAFYQFTDIAADQEKWDAEHLLSDETREWDNPYYGFPQMIRFAFHPSKAAQARLAELRSSGNTYAFSALFKPKSIKKTNDGSHKKFVWEQEVLDLFEVIDGSKKEDGLLGFLDYDRIKDGNMCRHIVCVLPYCASCDALETLLTDHRDQFKNLQSYTIINISGVDKPNQYKNIHAVKEKIASCEENNQKTITLTVNRMLTGSTVEQWDTMLFLKDTVSPQEYDQAIFRLQNQYIKTYVDESGRTIQYNMKPQTLLVDFDPHRLFVMQEQKSLIYNANMEEGGNRRLEERMQEELRISPVITINQNRIMQVGSADILSAVSAYSKNRGVMDESREIPVDLSLFRIEIVKAAIEAQAELGSGKGLQVDAHVGEESDLDSGDDADKGSDGTSGEQDGERESGSDESSEDNDRQKWENKFRMYYSRILFYAFLSENTLKSLDDILSSMEDADNARIARNLLLEKTVLQAIRKHINLFILSRLDYKIQNINALAHDETVEPAERAVRAIDKFGKLSESEVPTPLSIAKEMVALLPDECFSNIQGRDTVMLDIASKMGEFAIAVCERAGSLGIPAEKIASSVYAIPTSSVAYEFTRKIYSVLGLDTDCIAARFTSYDLLDVRKTDEGNENDHIDYEKISNILKQKKKFSDISLHDEAEEGGEMKFEAIVGNPPYQENISTNSDNLGLGKQLFPYFTMLSVQCDPEYASLIIPSRWFTGDAQDKSFIRLREFIKKNNHIKALVNFKDENDVFHDVEIKGGVSYFLSQKNYSGDVIFTNVFAGERDTQVRELFIADMDIVISDGKDYPILTKVLDDRFVPLTDITTGRNAFGIISKSSVVDSVSREERFDGAAELRCMSNKIRFIKPESITKNREIFESYKVFISKSAGSPKSDLKVIGTPYVGMPMSACTDSLIAIGRFDNETEAVHLAVYLKTKFLRFLVSILKSSHNVTQIVYRFVPMQDFTDQSDINWNADLSDVDRQLYEKYGLTQEERDYIENKIKSAE